MINVQSVLETCFLKLFMYWDKLAAPTTCRGCQRTMWSNQGFKNMVVTQLASAGGARADLQHLGGSGDGYRGGGGYCAALLLGEHRAHLRQQPEEERQEGANAALVEGKFPLDVLVAAAAVERRAGASQVIRAEDGLVEGLVAHRRERQVERIHAASTIRHKDHTERRQVELALPLELQAAAPRGEVDAVAGEHEVLVVDRRRLPVWRQRRIV
mmetsp:Transcript_9355/g.20470  ORF Transcript_9355/g.20470 Transcript_9355/m.20470 type:complete len:213 (-) Transcript_9355:45-683(-)